MKPLDCEKDQIYKLSNKYPITTHMQRFKVLAEDTISACDLKSTNNSVPYNH